MRVVVDPDSGVIEWRSIKIALRDAARPLLRDQACTHQHLDVTRDCLQRHGERLSQLRHQRRAFVEPAQDRPAHRIGQREEDTVQRFLLFGGGIAFADNGEGHGVTEARVALDPEHSGCAMSSSSIDRSFAAARVA